MSDPAAPLSDEALLDRCQATAFDYFLENVNDANGLVADTWRDGSPASIAVVGFALSCYPIGVERGWISRARAAELTLAALRFFRDTAHGREDDATGHRGFYYHIAPWSFLASLPFPPDVALSALCHLLQRYPQVAPDLRMPSAFNPTLAGRRDVVPDGWISQGYYGLDQEITVMMIENYRSGLIWQLMRSNPHIRAGLRRAGFSGGWLAQGG